MIMNQQEASMYAELIRALESDRDEIDTRIEMLKDELKNLSEREHRILYMRFMQGKTQMETAAEIGISQAQVSRLEKNVINRIKGK